MPLRRRWKILLGVLGLVVAALIVPALIPPGRRYDPAPYFLAVKQSAALPSTRGDTPPAGDLVIRRARIVDANGVRGPTSIRIEAGRITAIADEVAGGPNELDAGGSTVMPGLIDAHAHVSLTPGGLTRRDDAATTRVLRLHHMRAYLACGVTTVFDPAVENVVMEDVRRSLEAGHAGPRYLGVGTPLVTPGGYGASLWPPGVRRPEEVGPRLDAIIKAGGVGVEGGLRAGFRAAGLAAASTRDRARHSRGGGEAQAADLRACGARGRWSAGRWPCARTPWCTGPSMPPGSWPRRSSRPGSRSSPPWRCSTLTRSCSTPSSSRRHTSAGWCRRSSWRACAIGASTAITPSACSARWSLRAGTLPGPARLVCGTAAGLRAADDQNQDLGRSARQSVRYLDQAGAMLVVGSDSGDWPLFPYYFHGPTTWRELRLLAQAGLSAQEVLRAATVNSAKMLGLADQIGTVEVGRVADLVVVRQDARVDVEKAMRSLQYAVRAGVARTPDAWMASR